ncbi:MAG: hypothetical protein ACKVP3_22070 [Hyphomicrobiaceae bacterium]
MTDQAAFERSLPDGFMDFIREVEAVVSPGEDGIVIHIDTMPVLTVTLDQASNLSEEDKDTLRVVFSGMRPRISN